MSMFQTIDEIEYPETDGQPMGETDLHRNWMIRIFDRLNYRYRDQRVYVASDLLVYYEEGEPSRYIVPDVFVVTDCQRRDRRVFKTWEEKRTPNVAIEVTSRSTRRHDLFYKPRVYAEIGISEYFLYDPTSEYLLPQLKGFRLENGAYVAMELDHTGALECQELDLRLRLEAGQLVIYDRQTGDPLRTEAEAERLARETAEARMASEVKARRAAEARAQTAEEELRRLRD